MRQARTRTLVTLDNDIGQAEQTILDVVEAVSDPQTMLSVNTGQLRAMLGTMNRAQAETAFQKLERKLSANAARRKRTRIEQKRVMLAI